VERKRPYFRYSLKSHIISFDINLSEELEKRTDSFLASLKIRERKNTGVLFSIARSGEYFSNVTIWIGAGRERKEKKINLTISQGKFLFNLPFPDGEYMTPDEIRIKSGLEAEQMPEILNLVEELISFKVIEIKK
jgi:hypothetical protein